MMTGFSPYELLHSRNIRGSLDLMREQWTARKKIPDSVVAYVLNMQERLMEMGKLARERKADVKQVAKHWYDGNARFRFLTKEICRLGLISF